MSTKTLKIICATAFSLSGLLFADMANATIKHMNLNKMSQVNNFCSGDDIACSTIQSHALGFTVYYEVVNSPSSGPKRDDGDNDADCGNLC